MIGDRKASTYKLDSLTSPRDARFQHLSNDNGRTAVGQERHDAPESAFRPYLGHRRATVFANLLRMLLVVESLQFFLVDGRIDPGIAEQPGVPDNRITRLQPIIGGACALPCLASNSVTTTAPGKRASANPLAETSLGLVGRLRFGPGVDQIPNSNLVFVGQAVKQCDKFAERPIVVVRPRENEVE